MADYPTELSAVTDNVDDVLAKYVNNIEAKLGIGAGTAASATVGQALIRTSTAGESLWSNNPGSLFRQALINGNMGVSQRGTSFTSTTITANNNDTYLIDRWTLLSDGNDIVDVSQSTDSPDGSKHSIKFQVETANKKFGICQIIENKDAMELDNKTVSISFQAKTTTAKLIENLRVAVLSWDDAVDITTSDLISAWAAEGTNPTFVANWTAENIATNKAITTSWATYKVEGISIDTAGMVNIAVFIWVDDTDAAVDDELFISQIQLCEGSIALPFQPKSFEQEYQACQRYYQKSFNYSVTPAQATTAKKNHIGATFSADGMRIPVVFPVKMRVPPTVTLYGDNAVAGDNWSYFDGAWTQPTSESAISSECKFYVEMTHVASFTLWQCLMASGFWTAYAEL